MCIVLVFFGTVSLFCKLMSILLILLKLVWYLKNALKISCYLSTLDTLFNGECDYPPFSNRLFSGWGKGPKKQFSSAGKLRTPICRRTFWWREVGTPLLPKPPTVMSPSAF